MDNQKKYLELTKQLDKTRDTANFAYLAETKRILGDILKFEQELMAIYGRTPGFLPLGTDRVRVSGCHRFLKKLKTDFKKHCEDYKSYHGFSKNTRVITTPTY